MDAHFIPHGPAVLERDRIGVVRQEAVVWQKHPRPQFLGVHHRQLQSRNLQGQEKTTAVAVQYPGQSFVPVRPHHKALHRFPVLRGDVDSTDRDTPRRSPGPCCLPQVLGHHAHHGGQGRVTEIYTTQSLRLFQLRTVGVLVHIRHLQATMTKGRCRSLGAAAASHCVIGRSGCRSGIRNTGRWRCDPSGRPRGYAATGESPGRWRSWARERRQSGRSPERCSDP